MWPFRRHPPTAVADPIGDICRLLCERWWEWAANRSKEGSPALQHSSGTFIVWLHGTVWLGTGDSPGNTLSNYDSTRVIRAIHGNFAARISNRPFRFTDAALALAAAIQAGQYDAAYGLVDELLEHQRTRKDSAS